MKFKYAYIALVVLLSSACERLDPISAPDFNVRIDTTTFRVGEEVVFHFSGDAGIISFYSGEDGHDYAFKDGNQIDPIERLTMQFESHNQELATRPEEHEVTAFRVMLSTDFSGQYHYEAVTNATWADITERFSLADPGTWSSSNPAYVPSGAQNILNLVEPGTPFHVAFRYDVPERTSTHNLTRRWRMRNFQLIGQTVDRAYVTLGTYSPATWELVAREDPRITLTELAADNLLFAPSSAGSQASVEEWVISPQYSVNEVPAGAGFGIGIKGYGNPTMTEFAYVYENPGVYNITFVAMNENIEERHEIVRHLRIVVLP